MNIQKCQNTQMFGAFGFPKGRKVRVCWKKDRHTKLRIEQRIMKLHIQDTEEALAKEVKGRITFARP